MRELTFEAFHAQLRMVLRDLPPGIAAELSADMVAYWNGRQVVYAFLREDGGGQIDDEFEPEDYEWAEFRPVFAAWLASPKFAPRSEVLDWMKDAPPFDSGR